MIQARTCPYCQEKLDPYDQSPYYLHRPSLDLTVPLERGGTPTPGNLQIICTACNLAKRTMTGNEYKELISYLPRGRFLHFRQVWVKACLADKIKTRKEEGSTN